MGTYPGVDACPGHYGTYHSYQLLIPQEGEIKSDMFQLLLVLRYYPLCVYTSAEIDQPQGQEIAPTL